MHRVDVASIATRLLVGQSMIQAFEGQETFFSSRSTRPALGPTQSPINWIVGVKWPELEVNQSSPPSAEVKNESCYNSTCPVCLHYMDKDNFACFFKLWSGSSKILEFLLVLWLGKYAHRL